MLFTGQEYCKILNKNALPCIHGVHALLAVCGRVKNLGSDNSLKSPQISKVSVQKASNTPWMQGKAFLLRIYSIPVPYFRHDRYYAIRPQLELGCLCKNPHNQNPEFSRSG